jgi:hypothetical protein
MLIRGTNRSRSLNDERFRLVLLGTAFECRHPMQYRHSCGELVRDAQVVADFVEIATE